MRFQGDLASIRETLSFIELTPGCAGSRTSKNKKNKKGKRLDQEEIIVEFQKNSITDIIYGVVP